MTARLRPLLTGAVTAAVTVAAGAAAIAGPAPLAVAGGLLLAFLLPGLALIPLIFRYRVVTGVERAVLAPALSLAVTVVAGLGLYVAGFGLDRISWTLGIGGLTLVVLALRAVPERVWLGEADPREDDDAEPRTRIIPVIRPPFRPRVKVGQLIVLGLAAMLVSGAGWLSYRGSVESQDATVTALSAAPPGDVNQVGDRDVEVFATGLVAADGPYLLTVTDPDGRRTVRRTIRGDRDIWSGTLTLPADTRMTVALHRAGDSTPYRTVVISATE